MARRKRTKDLSRRDFIKTAAGAVGAVTIGGALIGARNTPEPIRLGMLCPLEGECAQDGVPIFRGGLMWGDYHNANGGLLCGDGQRHPIECDGYTNVCYIASEELKAAKRAILDDKKKFLHQTYTPACRKAVAPLTSQHKVLCSSYGAGWLSSEFPYMMAGMTGHPTSVMPLFAHVLEQNPEVKRVAIVCTDDSYGISYSWYFQAACAPYKDRVKVVYNRTFDPKLSDFYNLLGAVLREKPDVILEAYVFPGKQAILLETGYQLGYEGLWVGSTWSIPHILQRVSPEQMEGRVYQVGLDAAVPGFNQRIEKFYKDYCERFGEQEWVQYAGITHSSVCTFEVGFQEAKSVDPKTVKDTLFAMPEIDHPIYGKSVWTGKEVFGSNQHLLTPSPIYVTRGGKLAYSGSYSLGPWWKENKDVALPVLKEGGQTAT